MEHTGCHQLHGVLTVKERGVESASPTPWKYGGVYLDTDVVVMQELYNLKNAVGLYKLNPVYP
jgi:hypothetical protein